MLHYALIIATYLHMTGQYRGQVRYQLPPEAACQAAVSDLNVDPRGDGLVILGWGLPHLAGAGPWTPGGGFAWTRGNLGGHRVLYLGYLHSIWGDVAGRVVARLAALAARNVVYIGKVGSLDPQIIPNTRLATGNSSIAELQKQGPDLPGGGGDGERTVHRHAAVTDDLVTWPGRQTFGGCRVHLHGSPDRG